MNYQVVTKQNTLKSILHEKMGGLDQQGDIPWIVRLLENPTSPIALPGKISLENHDCLHILLDRDITPQGEAFVIGFTMGNDLQSNWLHRTIFKVFSRFIYPKKFQFSLDDLKSFDLGFFYGKKISKKSPNLNQIDFTAYYDKTVEELRAQLEIQREEIELTAEFEQWLQGAEVPYQQQQLLGELVPSY